MVEQANGPAAGQRGARPVWVGYVVTVALEVALTAVLLLLMPHLELGKFPTPYVLLSMVVGYFFGTGPAMASVVVGWIFFTYYFVEPPGFWPIADSPREWSRHIALLLGVIAISIAAVQARESQRRIRGLADEASALNVSLRDQIDERNRAEEAARESEERFRSMVDAIPQLAWMADPDGYIFWYNRRWYDYTGTTPEQMEGWGWQSVHDPELLPAIVDKWKQSLEAGVPYEMEFPLRGADGRFRRFLTRAFPLKDSEGRVTRWFGTNTDVSDLFEAQEAVRESESKYRTLFTSMREAFMLIEIIFDESGKPKSWRYLDANPAWQANTGIDEKGIIGKTVHEVLPEIESYWIESFGSVAVTGSPVRLEQYNKDLKRYYLASAFPADAGQVGVLFSDITSRRNAEEEVRRLNAELEQRVQARTAELEVANKELEAFSYSVSHDLRAPLRAIDGFSNAVLKGYLDQLDERGQDYLQRIRAASQRMAKLIDDILGLSRAGRAEMHVQNVDLSAVALDVLEDLRKTQPERRLELDVKPGLVVQGDSHLLRIALDNLLGNAWKFTSGREVAKVEVGSLELDGERVYYVRDNGAGFDPTYADKLFSPFQRLHTDQEFPGTGIGLALVQRILRRHGGRIWAESAVDQGATFYFTLGRQEDG